MRPRIRPDRRCTYALIIDADLELQADDLVSLSQYLADLSVAGCEVQILDASASNQNERFLRWSGQYQALGAGEDPVCVAALVASCEKVILAAPPARYEIGEIGRICDLLDLHEVVEPQDYLDPLPWWGALDAGQMLVHRALGKMPDHGSTFGFRRQAVRRLAPVNGQTPALQDHVRRLSAQGTEIFSALDLFVRRCPTSLRHWLRGRVRRAEADLGLPVRSTLFFGLMPIAFLLAFFGGLPMAAGFGGAIFGAAAVLALRGRQGAHSYFPLRSVLLAPLGLLERSLAVYWALALRMRKGSGEPWPALLSEGRNPKVASGQ